MSGEEHHASLSWAQILTLSSWEMSALHLTLLSLCFLAYKSTELPSCIVFRWKIWQGKADHTRPHTSRKPKCPFIDTTNPRPKHFFNKYSWCFSCPLGTDIHFNKTFPIFSQSKWKWRESKKQILPNFLARSHKMSNHYRADLHKFCLYNTYHLKHVMLIIWWTTNPEAIVHKKDKTMRNRDFPVIQWLRIEDPNAGGPGSIPGQGTRPHLLQLRVPTLPWRFKMPPAATMTQCSRINNF